MTLFLSSAKRREISAVLHMFYEPPRKSTADIARLMEMHESDVWKTLARYGGERRAKYMKQPRRGTHHE